MGAKSNGSLSDEAGRVVKLVNSLYSNFPSKEDVEKWMNTSNSFDDQVFDQLPDMLHHLCGHLKDKTDKEVFLVGALGVISGMLPNYQGFYDGHIYTPHLYCYILAPYGTGKGTLNYAESLGKKLHKSRLKAYMEEKETYETDCLEFEKDFAAAKKSAGTVPQKPQEPKLKLLFIPANNSKTGILELLNHNNGRGIIFETEADALVNALKQDYGNYSENLRNAFHHEGLRYYRRGGKELVEIERPELAIVLSSTYDQLLKLVPQVENGLFSRFFYYKLKPNLSFRDVFAIHKNEYSAVIEQAATLLQSYHRKLQQLDNPILFDFTAEQKQAFLSRFRTWTSELVCLENIGLKGIINRLGLICFRVAMVLTMLRQLQEESLPQKLICKQEDFENAFRIVSIFKENVLDIYEFIPKSRNPLGKKIIKPEQAQAFALYKEGKTQREIAKELHISKTTIARWLRGTKRGEKTTATKEPKKL